MAKKIYIVEDDEGILEAMSILLREEGYSVETLLDASKAHDKIKKYQPDLVLLDVLMSGADGRDICAEIKKDPETKAMKVVMVSAHPTAKSSVFHYGADDFLAKPFEMNDLLRMAAKYVE